MTELEWPPPGPGPWRQDRAHLPASVTPLLQELYPEPMDRGFRETTAPFGLLLDSIRLRFVNGFAYGQPVGFDAPGPDGARSPEWIGAEIARRTETAAAAMHGRIWRDVLRYWDDELKPASIEKHRSLGDVDLAALDDEGLRAHLHACITHMREMWYQHHRYNSMTMIPVGDFIVHAARWTGRPPSPMFEVFDGWSPVSSVLPPELVPVIEALKADPESAATVTAGGDAAERLSSLCERVPAVRAYLRDVGFRIAAGFDLTNPTIRERPDLVLGRIRAALDHDVVSGYARSEALADELREAVPAEHREEFDEMLTEARLMYRLRDERGLYSDSSAVGLMRLGLIELGRRLYERGRIAFMYDTLDLTSVELDGILDGHENPTAEELRARVAARKARSATGAPPWLGDPPTPPHPIDELPPPLARVMAAMGVVLDGVGGEAPAPMGEAGVIVGISGSRGVFQGPARIVRNFDDLLELEEGDVLVTPATGESFNSFLHVVGAIVTDHGSFASHAAIMGREMGFPVVVGTVDATRRIPNRATVRVDGTEGVVVVVG